MTELDNLAIEQIARAIAARKMGLNNQGERLPDDLWMQALPKARIAYTIAMNLK